MVSRNFKRLEELTENLIEKDNKLLAHEELLTNICDSSDKAIWAKDANNLFVFANKVCCEKMLHCSEGEAISQTDSDFGGGMAIACTESDKHVRDSGIPMRFIEHNGRWWDTLKTPLVSKGNIIGTVGTAKDISGAVPQNIKNEFKDTKVVIIPVETILCKDEIIKLFTETTK